MKPDITSRKDIELIENIFYCRVRRNSVLSYIFNDIAKINWETHLPKMYSFWARILSGEHSFSSNPMQKHIALRKQTTMCEVELSEWLSLFIQTTDELFKGEKAEEVKTRATNIAQLMLYKIQTV